MDNLTVSFSEAPFNKDVTLLTVKGSLDTNTVSEFDKNFQSVLQKNRFKLVIDLKDAHYISSAGWGLFVSEIRRIRGENGDLVLAGMVPDVLDVFELLQFNTILKFFPDVETAVNKGFIGLPPWAGKISKKRVKKTTERAAPLEPAREPVPTVNLEKTLEPAASRERVRAEILVPYWRRVLGDWHFWALVFLLILGIYWMGQNMAWQADGGILSH